jgi:type II secretory pathway component PulF
MMADSLLLRFQLNLARKTLRRKRSNFYYELGASLREHVPLVSTMRKYETRARLRGSSEALVYLEILRGLQNGSLSSAMQHIATPMELTLMDATQSAGDGSMADGLQFLAATVEKADNMRATLIKSLLYPFFLLLMFNAMLTVFSRLAVPVLVELMPPEKWPPLGRLLYWMSQTVTEQGLWALLVVVDVLILFVYSLKRWTGPWRRWVDDYFPYNIYRDFSGALLLVSLASMMKSGVSLRTSLMRTQNFATPWLRWHVRKILFNLSRSNTPYFGQAFQTGVLNLDMADRVQDASERRNPVEAFIRTGSRSIDLMVVVLERRAKIINMTMLVVCGLLLGLMFAGFMSTAMSMQSGLREGR